VRQERVQGEVEGHGEEEEEERLEVEAEGLREEGEGDGDRDTSVLVCLVQALPFRPLDSSAPPFLPSGQKAVGPKEGGG